MGTPAQSETGMEIEDGDSSSSAPSAPIVQPLSISPPKTPPVQNYKDVVAQGVTPASLITTTGPKKTFGVLVKRTPGVNLEEALHAVAKVIDPTKIIYADFLSAANFGIWFDSEETANEFMRQDTVKIRGEAAKLHRYANPIRRVVLRSVPPFVPDALLLKTLEKYGEARSAVTHQPVYGLSDKYSHIRSFTRSVEISFKGNEQIPPQIKVTCDGVDYVISTQVGARKCFKCQKPGHVSKDCPLKKVQTDGAQAAKGSKNKNRKQSTSVTKVVDAPESVATDNDGAEVESTDKALDGDVFVAPKAPRKSRNKRSKFEKNVSMQSGDDTDTDGETRQRKIATRSQSQSSSGSGKKVPISRQKKDPAPWGYDNWKSRTSFNTYETVTPELLYAFLQCLRSSDPEVEFQNLEKQALLVTRNVRDLYELLYEVQQSLGSSLKEVKTDISNVLSDLRELADMTEGQRLKIYHSIDESFRNSEFDYYKQLNQFSNDEIKERMNFFFN